MRISNIKPITTQFYKQKASRRWMGKSHMSRSPTVHAVPNHQYRYLVPDFASSDSIRKYTQAQIPYLPVNKPFRLHCSLNSTCRQGGPENACTRSDAHVASNSVEFKEEKCIPVFVEIVCLSLHIHLFLTSSGPLVKSFASGTQSRLAANIHAHVYTCMSG